MIIKESKNRIIKIKKEEKLLPYEIEAGIMTEYSEEILNYHLKK